MVIQEGFKFTAAPYTEFKLAIILVCVAVFTVSHMYTFLRLCILAGPVAVSHRRCKKPEAFRRNRKGAEACTIRALSRDRRESPSGDLRGFACEGRVTGAR